MKWHLRNNEILKPSILVSLFAIAFSFTGLPQDGFTITGKVTDEYETPLPGTSVVEKGTTNGVSTDFDGNYSIEVSNQNAVLVISYIGYAEQEIPVEGNSTIDVTMVPSASTLDEVVLVGYGAVKKKDLTGAISQVEAEEDTDSGT